MPRKPRYYLAGVPCHVILAYRELFREEPDPVDVQSLRTAINLCVPVGNDRFKAKIERRLEQRISYRLRRTAQKGNVGLSRAAGATDLLFTPTRFTVNIYSDPFYRV